MTANTTLQTAVDAIDATERDDAPTIDATFASRRSATDCVRVAITDR